MGHTSLCKECCAKNYINNREDILKQHKEYYLDHREDKLKYQKEYYLDNREDVLKYQKEYNLDHIEDRLKQQKEYYLTNREDILKQNREYYLENREDILKYKKEYYLENREDILKYKKEYYLENREDILQQHKEYYIEHKKDRLIYQKEYYVEKREDILGYGRDYQKEYKISPALFNTFAHQLTVEEQPRETEDGYLEVKCSHSECSKYFIPTNQQVKNRIQALNGNMRGESRLYCSEKCKQECSLYYQKKYPKGFEPETLDTEFPAFVKKEIFKRDKYKCQICGRTHDLQAHHEFPGSTHHMLSKDVKNGITLCKECHIKVHMLPGCSFSDIASCSQKIKKDLEEKGINLREIPDWAVDKYLKPKENKNVVKRKNVH